MDVQTKRIYDPPDPGDGYRVLVDGLWPRGIARADAKLDEWARELAPSSGLRKWFNHDPARFSEFRRRYSGELGRHGEEIDALRRRAREGRVTLLYAARDAEHNNAAVLAEVLSIGSDGAPHNH